MFREIRLTMDYPHPPAEVWKLLTDRDEIAVWLMPNDFAPEVGHAFTMTTRPAPGFDGVIRARVLELEPDRRMLWEWIAGGMTSFVAFDLAPTERGTQLTLVHSGFRGLGTLLPWVFMRHGWKKKVAVTIAERLRRARR